MSQATAIALGCILVGALCVVGAIQQIRKGETTGATGKGRVTLADDPAYFWYLFAVRSVLGSIAFLGGVWALL